VRHMSFMLTERQFLDGTKTVTRRLGWRNLKKGDRLRAVRKSQGLKKGEHPVVLGTIEVVSVCREPLDAITQDDVRREGFGSTSPREFVHFFCKHMRCQPDAEVTRIEFRKVEASR
jgi:hypothetical protein